MLKNSINNVRKARGGDGGFTLIELLIVITVLGILAGIVVFGVATFRDDANTAAHKADCKTVSVAAEAYVAKNGGAYPSVATLVTDKYIKTAPAGVGPTIAADGTPAGC
jgi:general secretion pathway protein G